VCPRVIPPEVHLNEHLLGGASRSGDLQETPGEPCLLQASRQAFSFPFSAQRSLSFFLHRDIADGRRGLHLDVRDVDGVLVLLAHGGHAGGGQARRRLAAFAGVRADAAAHAAEGVRAGGGGDAAQVGRDAGLAAGVDAARQAGGAHDRRGGDGAHALDLALQEVGQHLTFALDAYFAAAHQVVVAVQQPVDVFGHLETQKPPSGKNTPGVSAKFK